MRRSSGASDLTDLTLDWVTETADAIAVRLEGRKVWLPKSAIEYERDPAKRSVTVTLPEWLAIDKGLV
jgi:hypothetical protein